MLKLTISAIGFALLALGVMLNPAQAQATRVFVAAQGSDSNPCTFALPCRTFQKAHDTVAALGEIDVLDPAGYGSLTITKSIGILGHGFAGISVSSGGTGITITAGVNDIVNLRGLIIEGNHFGIGQNGIFLNAGGSLIVQDCTILNLDAIGIDFEPNASGSLTVSDTFVSGTAIGIHVLPSGSGTVTAVFNRAESDNNQYGIIVNGFNSTGGKVTATAVDSVVAGNSNTGFFVNTQSGGATASLMVLRSVVANNLTGITANFTGSTLWMGQSTVTGNTAGWSVTSGGVVQSYGTNQITGNGSAQGQAPAVNTGSN
jgi:hypothetical protein